MFSMVEVFNYIVALTSKSYLRGINFLIMFIYYSRCLNETNPLCLSVHLDYTMSFIIFLGSRCLISTPCLFIDFLVFYSRDFNTPICIRYLEEIIEAYPKRRTSSFKN